MKLTGGIHRSLWGEQECSLCTTEKSPNLGPVEECTSGFTSGTSVSPTWGSVVGDSPQMAPSLPFLPSVHRSDWGTWALSLTFNSSPQLEWCQQMTGEGKSLNNSSIASQWPDLNSSSSNSQLIISRIRLRSTWNKATNVGHNLWHKC